MTIQIDVAQLGPALIEDLSQNGGEITLTRDGKPIAKLVRVEGATDAPSEGGRVLYKGERMSAAGAERERAMERLHGSVKIHGDIVSPVYENDGPLAGSILYEGDIVSPVICETGDSAPPENGRVLYNGRWMIPEAAERERSIEHLRGSGRILGDIVSPIDDAEWDTYE
ncbi:MAG: hypothetical protein QOE68_1709 [Thermoanaerobaculia bacterium]|jgi:antitoxin (DNA-binding transcriptional repressor) of toxin-antitoxin stability system|nr:hypothetical protein [Thermoanaerobaculia bacterium]